MPRATIFHSRLQQFIAYISKNNDDNDTELDVLKGVNWRMIQWKWKSINNLSISTSTAMLSFYVAQTLSLWIFVVGSYQWYVDIGSFIKYLNNYGDKYSIWRKYECYGLIVTNTPNMKQLILILGLICWAHKVGTISNYQMYLQKRTYLQLTLLFGYFLLVICFIPIIFTHFIPLFIPVFILLFGMTLSYVACTQSKISVKSLKMRRQKVQAKIRKMSDVTNSDSGYGCHFRVMVTCCLWKIACAYFVVILCVPVLSRVYNGDNIWNAFSSVYNQRDTSIYFQNLCNGYAFDLDRLRLLLYWMS